MQPEQRSEVTQKVCGGCGRPAQGEIGQLYYCEWVLRMVPLKIKRTPLWQGTRS